MQPSLSNPTLSNLTLDTGSIANSVQESPIRAIANYGMTLPDVVPLWFGEADIPTPAFIREAAAESLARFETRYTPNTGLPTLRAAIARYQNDLYGSTFDHDNIVVTVSGTNAVMLAAQTFLSPGDKVVAITPIFPTLTAIPKLLGAEVVEVPLAQDGNSFRLDLDALFSAARGARAIIINSPANPTGWTASIDEIRAILGFARQHGIWILSDEVYARHVYGAAAAPSFCSDITEDDRVIVCNSFSKAWCMTGWRLGWVTLPKSLVPTVRKLIEFNVSCAPAFVQAGGLAAVEKGEKFLASCMARFAEARDLVSATLSNLPGVTLYDMDATFYAFLKIDGLPHDSKPYVLRLIEEARLGVAPGEGFGAGGEGHLRLCYGVAPEILAPALQRFRDFLISGEGRSRS
jgi:aspartate/methionine/tyrosine aminotransferase